MVFVLDSSGSIKLENWQKVLNFTKSVVNNIEVGPGAGQVGVITYGFAVRKSITLGQYQNKQALMNAIDGIKYLDESTNTGGALSVMRSDYFSAAGGDRIDSINLAIVVTDGAPTVPDDTLGRLYTKTNASKAREEGTIIFAIGVGDINRAILEEIASPPTDQFVFSVTDFDALDSIKQSIQLALCEVADSKSIPNF